MGIELESASLRWIEVHGTAAAQVAGASGRVKFGGTRDAVALKDFTDKLQEVFAEIEPSSIAIREKPQIGRMRAGSATFYMEAVLLLCCECPVKFVSNNEISKLIVDAAGVKEVDILAYKAAVLALRSEPV